MSNINNLDIRTIIMKEFGYDLPISGGQGDSTENALKIDSDYEDWTDVEYTVLRLLHRFLKRSWKLVSQSTFEVDGRIYDKLSLEVDGDNTKIFNYYFDVSDHQETALFGGGTNWPDPNDSNPRPRFKI